MKAIVRELPLRTTHPFVIARGGGSEYTSVVCVLEAGGLAGAGEGSPSPYYGETPAITRAALETVLAALSWALLLAGSAFAIVGGIGLLRLPDFYSRIHGAGITDTMGAGLILVGLMLQAPSGLVVVKLVMILFFLLLTSPTSTHALSQSALAYGLEPWLAEQEDPSSRKPG